MELLFIHISKPYGVLDNKNFNLSSKYIIDYNVQNNELIVQKNQDYIKDFFGRNISNVTSVIGENGVGKTTFLRYIKELYFEKRNEIDIRTGDIIAYIKDEILIIHASFESEIKVNTSDTGLKSKTINYKRKPKVFDHLKNELTIYYSNNFDLYDDFVESEILYNTSTPFLSRTYNARINKEFKTKKVNSEQRFLLNEFQRNRKFLHSDKSKSIKSVLKEVDYIEIIPISKTDRDYKNLVKSVIKSNPNLGEEEKESFQELTSTIGNTFYTRKKGVITDPRRQLFDIELSEIIVFEVLSKFLKSKFHINDFDYLNDVFIKPIYNNQVKGYLTTFLRKMPEFFLNNTSDWSDKKDELRKYFGKLENLVNLLIYNDELWFDFQDRATVKTNSNLLDQLISAYFNLPFSTNSIKLDWSRLSAGEESMVTFFSRIDGALRLKSKKRNNILILIDEGDLYFHPDWQRKYLNTVFDFLNQYGEYNFQIILTSHSPFILSDLPQENVITFEKNNNKIKVSKKSLNKTFGGNIHELLIDEFFLKDGVIGAFADKKILNLIKRINKKHITENDKTLIKKIGDTFLKAAIETNLEDSNDKN